MIPFRKMHGLGNDFVVLDARGRSVLDARGRSVLDARGRNLGITPERAAWLANRHTGIGCDQVIILEPTGPGADVFMRILNPDGSEAGACGNATRCVAALVADELGQDQVTIRTIAGELPVRRLPGGLWCADMGAPRLGWQQVPLAEACDTLHVPLSLGPLADPAACSMGNPHATFFVPDLAALDTALYGPQLERHPIFPQRVNVGFAQVLAPDRIRLVIWERGAGLTLACGSGACATIVNAARRGLTGRRASVELPGGTLTMEWAADDHVLMTGPVATSFQGEVQLP